VRPNIREFREHSVVYEDGVELPCDAVVFGTGYEVPSPAFAPAGLGPRLTCLTPTDCVSVPGPDMWRLDCPQRGVS
jgi:hypothetical protein